VTEVPVSIVIPMFNEAGTIERCILSVLDQHYPQDQIEIVVVDGLSRDGSREKVKTLAREHGNIVLLDNPARRTPAALNIGIRNARGQIVIILGAHTRIDEEFVRLNVLTMQEKGVKCVGGTQINVGETFTQRAIGLAMGSPFGIPSAPYRYRRKQGYVDTVVYAAYLRELFDQVGYFDETLHISEDAELNWRIRKAGHKIFYTPEIVSYYYPRRNLKRLIQQFFNYGILRSNVIRKHRDAAKAVHLIPPLFILSTVVRAVISFFNPLARLLLGLLWTLYLLYVVTASVFMALRERDLRLLLILPLIFLVMQVGWGAGFLVGFFKSR